MFLPSWAINALDEIDAGVFTGDTFIEEKAVKELEWYMNRWTREIEIRKEAIRIAKLMLEDK